jgi:hypothetical protein
MGETNPETATTYMNIGLVYSKQEDFKNASLNYSEYVNSYLKNFLYYNYKGKYKKAFGKL